MIRSRDGILQHPKVMKNWVKFGMNPRITFQFKSVCGVVKRGFMLVLMKDALGVLYGS